MNNLHFIYADNIDALDLFLQRSLSDVESRLVQIIEVLNDRVAELEEEIEDTESETAALLRDRHALGFDSGVLACIRIIQASDIDSRKRKSIVKEMEAL